MALLLASRRLLTVSRPLARARAAGHRTCAAAVAGHRTCAAAVAVAGAGFAALAVHPQAALCTPISDASKETKRELQQHLRLLMPVQSADAMLSRVAISIKGDRCSVRTTVQEAGVLPVLVPLLRAFPQVAWSSEANSSAAGDSLVLREHGATKQTAPIISLYVQPGGAEIELLGPPAPRGGSPPPLGSRELRAFAEALDESLRAGSGSNGQLRGGPAAMRPGGLLGELFGGLASPSPFDGPGGGGGGMRPGGGGGTAKGGTPLERLESLGVRVIMPPPPTEDGRAEPVGDAAADDKTWSALAGGRAVRATLEESLLLPLRHPEVYREVMTGTRKNEAVAPHAKAILFEGPPGCGKTSTARILAAQLGRPFVLLPLESLVSKWYGEAEQRLAAVFDACAEMGESIVFIDEIDALATSRDSDGGMHEATRRSLSVLLRRLDGFDANESTVLIAATNRPQDLDAALISRFELSITFPLPDQSTREAIFGLYAAHLRPEERERLAISAGGASGRDLRDVCEAAERKWAARRVRQEKVTASTPLPPPSEYAEALRERKGGTLVPGVV